MSSIPIPRSAEIERDTIWEYVDVCERIGAAALLLLLSPLLIGIGIIVLVLSGKAPLIAHRRVGQYGSELWLIKFRSMWQRRKRFAGIQDFALVEHIDDEVGPEFKGPEDGRVSSDFARFCRRHSLDELPQLIHVLLGQMSLVGPRPVTRAELKRLWGPHSEEILRAKPGLAGLWQVSGRNRLSIPERCRLDLECTRKRSLSSHFWILVKTVPEVLNGDNTW